MSRSLVNTDFVSSGISFVKNFSYIAMLSISAVTPCCAAASRSGSAVIAVEEVSAGNSKPLVSYRPCSRLRWVSSGLQPYCLFGC